MKTAVIGLGKMGLVHTAAIKTHPDVDLVAACDTSHFMVQALEKYIPGIRFYEDHRKMLQSEELDAVFVTTPTGSHAALAGDCVEAGKHLFVEKPLATTLAEAEQVASTVERRKLRSQVGYVCRYSPTFEKAREVLLSGALGRVRNFGSVKYSSDVLRKVEKSWRFLRKTPTGGGGGVVNEFSCHGVDLLVWFFGEPKGVQSRLESWYSEEVEDHVHALFDYGDFSGWFDSSWSMQDYRKPYNRIEITADNGRLMVTDSEVRWLLNKSHQGMEEGWHSHSVTDLYRPVRMFVGDIMFSRQAEDFISCVKQGGETRSPAGEALRTQRVLEAIHQGDKR